MIAGCAFCRRYFELVARRLCAIFRLAESATTTSMNKIIPEELRGEILAGGVSLIDEGRSLMDDPLYNLSEMFDGYPEFIRACEYISECFVIWASQNVEWENMEDSWLLLLQDRLGAAVVRILPVEEWQEECRPGCRDYVFGPAHCAKVARYLKLPVNDA